MSIGTRGFDDHLIEAKEAATIFPALIVDDLAAILYSAEAGFCDPILTTNTLAQKARELGCEIRQGVEVQKLRTRNGRVEGVTTNNGEVSCSVVVNAAGIWSANLFQPLGVNLGLSLRRAAHCVFRRQVAFLGHQPVLIDYSTGLYSRSDVGNLTISGYNDPPFDDSAPGVNPDRYDQSVDFDTILDFSERMCRRIRKFSEVTSLGGYACVYDMTADHAPIIGKVPNIEGLYVAAGNSGHGFKYAPAVGESMADLIMKGKGQNIEALNHRKVRQDAS